MHFQSSKRHERRARRDRFAIIVSRPGAGEASKASRNWIEPKKKPRFDRSIKSITKFDQFVSRELSAYA